MSKHSLFKQGSEPYPGHVSMRSDIQRGSTSSSAGRSKVTEGKAAPMQSGSHKGKSKGSHNSKTSY